MTPALTLRVAGAADAAAVAALHAASWRSAYRGLLADRYLDGPIEADRLGLWRDRLETAAPARVTILAERHGALVGFSSLLFGDEPGRASLVDNLHAHPAHRGLGVGRLLMRAMAAEAEARAPLRPIHLFCLEGNGPARGFYARLGGAVIERCEADEPDGGRHAALRFAWATPAALRRGCA